MRRSALLLMTALLLPIAGCDASVDVGGDGEDTQELEVRGARTGFTMVVDEDWGITDVWDADVCASVSYRVGDGGSPRLVVRAVPSTCPEAGADTQIGNGFHGVYRTIDDVPAPRDPETVETALGTATVFTQEYFECTNSCEEWDEPVAIVTLDEPVDPGYPTLVLRVERETVSRPDFEELVATLAAPYVPTG